MKRKVKIIGVPMDLGAGRRGVDMGPSVIRIAGLNQSLARLGYQVEGLSGERAGLIRQQKELRLEVARLKSLRRVEEIARQQLGLTSPKPGQMVAVESVPSKITDNELKEY